ncbi:protein-L-isoaspartate O-methyltransferase [Methylonatrum kenyense]|uniref:protein-L-isoaspartate O-methyltransferase family protein n=1 Tax=Methylonatrum kenyense TaxID=455253 RepID=UPI0020BD5730|nr:protein-L-isoaspartate O-methyltransferase [Methylonatrum kenyense]MCK8516675.1 protein-L-isoaspartate O-methyltransferase [Methylonatrum kenyense]
MNLEKARFNMIEQQVRTWDVLDPGVLDIMERLPRHEFVTPEHRDLAYSDLELPMGHGEVMLTPKLQGRILQALGASPVEQILEIGTGNGYLTACLAAMGAHVHSVDIHQPFLDTAARHLRQAEVQNVTLVEGDAAEGWDDGRRYDAIAVTGSLPRFHEGFHRSLTIGGRLFLIVGEAPTMEGLLITRVSETQWSRESILDTSIPPLVGAPRSTGFHF